MMKKPLLLLVFIAVSVGMFQMYLASREPQEREVTGLPWQVEILQDGHTRIFGVIPGQDTLGDAIRQLGKEYKTGIMVTAEESVALEVFYSRYTAGILSGKLVLGSSLDKATLLEMINRSPKTDYLGSGSRKYQISQKDLETVMASRMTSITFIPLTGLDKGIVMSRFGQAEEMIEDEWLNTHYLYPSMGLDVTIMNQGKDLLQYVAPESFASLREPLGNDGGP
ncbi:MAG: hypothetical protein V3W04_02795 [Gammaproteobacteria bacterium]